MTTHYAKHNLATILSKKNFLLSLYLLYSAAVSLSHVCLALHSECLVMTKRLELCVRKEAQHAATQIVSDSWFDPNMNIEPEFLEFFPSLLSLSEVF